MPIVYFNGDYLDPAAASVNVEDRGVLFGEGVYEVTRVYSGKPFEMTGHAERIRRSLAAIEIEPGDIPERLVEASHVLIEKNELVNGRVYWQVTRGVSSPRSFVYGDAAPTIFAAAYHGSPLGIGTLPETSIMLAEDRRWSEVWIKTTMLMPNNMALNAAKRAGCGHAALVKEVNGTAIVKEANSANLAIVKDGALITHPIDGSILPGITRDVALEASARIGIPVREEAFDVPTLLAADEILLIGTGVEVSAVTRVVEGRCGQSGPLLELPAGPVTAQVREAFEQRVIGTG